MFEAAGSWGPDNARAVAGAAGIVFAAWALGGLKRPPVRLVISALALQIALVVLMFGAPPIRAGLFSLTAVVQALEEATRAGSAFVFGYIGGGAAPFPVDRPENALSLAFQALPLVLVISGLSAVFWHWRILQLVCGAFAVLFRRLLGLSGAASLGVAANIFLGMVEAPILVRPYLQNMSRSDLFTLMAAGLATVAGTVLVIYAVLLEPILPGAAGHVVAASIMNAPAAILIARLMVPPDPAVAKEPARAERPHADEPHYASTMEALVTGVGEGLKLYLNIIAMLLVFVALVALINGALDALPSVNGEPLSVERGFGVLFRPVVWAIGIPWEEARAAGALYGVKTVLNEFIAYERLAFIGEVLDVRTRLIMTYALCGFANFGGLGIMLGGLTAMVPERKAEIVNLGLRSMIAGSLATLLTGAIIGALPAGLFGI
ncbi:MAG: nucleoside transporter C-terminal domain-containing protein [Maricaulaceae bacterium]|jgi:CNT family concentrative nucleoside transporter